MYWSCQTICLCLVFSYDYFSCLIYEFSHHLLHFFISYIFSIYPILHFFAKREGGLFQQHHFPGLYKLPCLYLVEIDSCTHSFTHAVRSIPPDRIGSCPLCGVPQLDNLYSKHIVNTYSNKCICRKVIS